MLGSYEFPDFPMSTEVYGVKPGSHIPGDVLHRYLTDFARKFGVLERMQFHSSVTQVVATPSDGWKLSIRSLGSERTIETAKLILATGLTSNPNMPEYEGQERFGNPFFHAKDFCRMAPELHNSKNVVVVGGAKSAYDVSYAMVESGATVDLVIRPNGHGPMWIAPRYVTPFKKRLDTILNVRFMSWFAPCPWGSEDGYPTARRFLHNNPIGRFFVRTFWKILSSDVLTAIQYDSHPELEKLKPWQSVFWTGSGLSVLNYDTSFLDMVRQGRIRVHIQNVDHLEPGIVVLASGTSVEADALICSTGWKKEPIITFAGLDEEDLALHLPRDGQKLLNAEFDAKVLEKFPVLKDQPQLRFRPRSDDPLRYYRFMVPTAFVERRNLAFAGMISSVSTSICATAQGLWITAFLDGKLDRIARSKEELTQEVMLHTQWGKWRYPCGYGSRLPDLAFEGIPYVDMLLKDLNLKTHRKGSQLAELTSPYTPRDYAGLFDEWRAAEAQV